MKKVSGTYEVKLSVEEGNPEVDIRLDLGLGQAPTEIFFADMGHEYITINAEYHT